MSRRACLPYCCHSSLLWQQHRSRRNFFWDYFVLKLKVLLFSETSDTFVFRTYNGRSCRRTGFSRLNRYDNTTDNMLRCGKMSGPFFVESKYFVRCKARSKDFEKRLLASSCPSVRPHGTTRLPLDGFSWNLIFEYFSNICLQHSSFIKIWQE